MERFTILCGMKDWIDGYKFMCDVDESLSRCGVKSFITSKDNLILHTTYTRIAFIYDISKQPLNGVEATAIFGQEPYKQKLAPYLKTGQAYNMGDGLVDYICKMEVEGKHRAANEAYENAIKEHATPSLYPKQIYITSARHNGKTEFQRWFEQEVDRMKEVREYVEHDVDSTAWLAMNHIYGKFHSDISKLPSIIDVIFNDPATIVFWADGTKTVVECQGEPYDPEKGLAMAMCKKMLGNKRDYYHTFKHWLKKCKEK